MRILEQLKHEARSLEAIREAAAAEAAADPLFWVDRDYCHRYLRQIPFVEPKALDELGQAQLVLRLYCRRNRDPDFDILFRRHATLNKTERARKVKYFCGIPTVLLTHTPESYHMRSRAAMEKLLEAHSVGRASPLASSEVYNILREETKRFKAYVEAGGKIDEINRRQREIDLTRSIVMAHMLRDKGAPRQTRLERPWNVICHLEDLSRFVNAVGRCASLD